MKITPKHKVGDTVFIAMSNTDANNFSFKLQKLTVKKVNISVTDDEVNFRYILSNDKSYPSNAILSSGQDIMQVCTDLVIEISTFVS